MKDLSPAGALVRNLSCLWLSGMREDRVFSSPTPAYVGNIIAHVSGYRDYMCAPFAQLKRAMRSGQSQDAETFVQALQVRDQILNVDIIDVVPGIPRRRRPPDIYKSI